jgi:hypothetical protein
MELLNNYTDVRIISEKNKAYLNCGFLGCDTVSFCAWLAKFRWKRLPPYCSHVIKVLYVTLCSLVDHYLYAYHPRVGYNGKTVDLHPGATG